jgi:hypothetical protein
VRRELVARTLFASANEISSRLKKGDVPPKWSDLIAALDLLARFVSRPAVESDKPCLDHGEKRDFTGWTNDELQAFEERGVVPERFAGNVEEK